MRCTLLHTASRAYDLPAITRQTLGQRFSLALETSAFATLILAWVTGYAVLCPAEPAHHHVARVVTSTAPGRVASHDAARLHHTGA